MKILITGGRGQLGRDCVTCLAQGHDVTAADLPELDIADPSAVAKLIESRTPEVVINCAGFTQVDACEKEPAAAWRVNAQGPEILAGALARYGARLIHISTDYVFDGRRAIPEPYLETDTPAPQSAYGRSKLAGEQAVLEASDRHMVVRTAWLYGANGANFPKTMLRLALNPKHAPIKVVCDQLGSPTWSWRLALQLARLAESQGRGIYHATAEGHGSWYDLACHFLERMAVPHALVPCTTRDYPTPATRPANSILENQRLKAEGLHLMAPWRDDVDRFVRAHGDRLMEEIQKETL
ncbi:MAG: dTDP-4-dehydrorhamnose reductase [Desulfobacterales bacterium]|nr:dTDP-4-dehydrorhamnose reductase [Desulfobacterales bacterium]